MSFSNICIDFGTCNTVISYFDNDIIDNKISQISDDYDGNILISTVLYFNETSIKSKNILDVDNLVYLEDYSIGNNINVINPNYYFYQFKRFLGITNKLLILDRNFIDKFNKEYTLDEDTIYFYIETSNNNKIKFSIVDLIKLYFKALYYLISKKLNINFDNKEDNKLEIVLTCPAYFHDLQRQQLKNAASAAGFKIFKLYNEPTTAAIYYIKNFYNSQNNKENNEYNKENNNNSNKFIVYDLGGGTIDTTVVEYHEEVNTCEIIDIDGNNSLGGIDIDNIIIYDIYSKYFIDKSNLKFKNKIKNIAEDIKIKLTYNTNYDIYLENVPIIKNSLLEYKDTLKISFTRHYFNSLINDIIEQMIEPIKNMYTKYNTSNIIFIGGPTQIPLLQNKVNLFLNKNVQTINNNSNNSILYKTIVSEGGTLLYNLIDKKEDFCLLDILPMNIGISDSNNNMTIMISKNSKIPTNVEKTFTTSYDCQRSIDIEIFEGIDEKCINNTFIGSYKIIGIPPLPLGCILIKLLFKITYNGILTITIEGCKNINFDNNYDYKLNENIKLMPSIIVNNLLKKLIKSTKL
jgi:molecular chaperone DnaK (HSP70)